MRQELISWEKRKEIGFFKALWQTVREVLFHPGKFFNKLSGVASCSDAFWFCILIVIINIVIELLIMLVTGLSTLKLLLSSLLTIIFNSLAGIFIFIVVAHLFILLFRGKGGYSGTFNVITYSYIPKVLVSLFEVLISCFLFLPRYKLLPTGIIVSSMFFPVFISIGLYLGLCWQGIITVIGYKRIHNFGRAKAIFAYLIPVVLSAAVSFGVSGKGSLKGLRQAKIEAYESKAIASCKVISTACEAYLATKNEYPFSLKDLANATPPYIDSNLAEADLPSKAIEGYYYIYEFLDNRHFTLYAKPAGPYVSEMKIFFINQTGILRLDGPDGMLVDKKYEKDFFSQEQDLTEARIISKKEAIVIAEADIEANIATALKLYELDNGNFPSTNEGLEALSNKPDSASNWNGPYLEKKPIDPWGREYKYKFPGGHNTSGYDLYSLGKDGVESDDDIRSLEIDKNEIKVEEAIDK